MRNESCDYKEKNNPEI